MIDFPTIFEWLERAEPLRGFPAAYVVLLAAASIVAIRDWRLTVLAMAVQYVAVSLLFVDVLDPRLAYVKLLVGLFICLMLYFTARQVVWRGDPWQDGSQENERSYWSRSVAIGRFRIPAATLLRVLLAAVVSSGVLLISRRLPLQLPEMPEHVTLALYALVALGLLAAAWPGEPFYAGAGLLLFMSGFELLYNALAQSAPVLVALAAANLALTLGIAYLTQAKRWDSMRSEQH